MQAKFRLTLVPFLLCVLLLVQTVPARAQGPSPSGPQAAAIFAVIMGIGAGIGSVSTIWFESSASIAG